jgi:hypothetical protein
MNIFRSLLYLYFSKQLLRFIFYLLLLYMFYFPKIRRIIPFIKHMLVRSTLFCSVLIVLSLLSCTCIRITVVRYVTNFIHHHSSYSYPSASAKHIYSCTYISFILFLSSFLSSQSYLFLFVLRIFSYSLNETEASELLHDRCAVLIKISYLYFL